ncbi:MAG: F0F1 ATP synthase subunit A [Alphaproteobacteria bacterium]|nr:F0F1 ATP synthase subunit A [Alphaproteobacteria bacterium]
MANPIHQFEIYSLTDKHFVLGGLDLSYTNSSLWMTIAVVFSTMFLTMAMRRKALVPGRMQVFAESIYGFVANMIRENIGSKGRQYFPLIFTLFIVVLLGNMLGMLPYSFTYTSHIIVTAALAFLIFFIVVLIGLFKHGFHFFSLFLPPGVPWWLMPLIVPIEIMSFMIRPVTLSVRLFANMIAGHIMLKVFAGFSVGMMAAGGLITLGGLGPMLFNSVLIGFEFLIAFLQAYVFTILSCIYLKDTVELGH